MQHRKTRIAFFGTSGWELTNKPLERFIEKGANIVVFVEAPAGKVKSTVRDKSRRESIRQVAERLDLPLLCPEEINNTGFQNKLSSYRPDVIVVCGYPLYFPFQVRNIAQMGMVNFHSSLLPRHSGMHPVFWTIWYGDKVTGMTVHFIDEGLDTGDIIYSSKVPVLTGDTVESLYSRILQSSVPLVDRLLGDFGSGNLPRTAQDKSKYFYNYDITEKDFELDFRQPAEILEGRVRMLPGKFYFVLKNEKYFVHDCRTIDEPLKTRKFMLNKPYLINRDIAFVTPQKIFAIKKIFKDGIDFNPLGLLEILS